MTSTLHPKVMYINIHAFYNMEMHEASIEYNHMKTFKDLVS